MVCYPPKKSRSNFLWLFWPRWRFLFFPCVMCYIMMGILLGQAEADFVCAKKGKFKDFENPNRYHQCFYLYGQLRYIHNTCPDGTCFDEILNYCISSACKIEKPVPTYNCTGTTYICKRPGVFASQNDSSVYYRCLKKDGLWSSPCFTCNVLLGTCFKERFCLPNKGPCPPGGIGEPDGSSGGGNSSNGNSSIGGGTGIVEGGGPGDGNGNGVTTVVGHPQAPEAATYQCEGYSSFPCETLGVGIHAKPGDPSVFWNCSFNEKKLVGECQTCPKETNSLYVDGLKKCVINFGQGPPYNPYDCSFWPESSFDCSKGEGLNYFEKDTSIFYRCVKEDVESNKIVPYCYTCGQGRCFNKNYLMCLPYSGSLCPGTLPPLPGQNNTNTGGGPSTNTSLGNGTFGKPEESMSYNCSVYNKGSVPCEKLAPNFGQGPHGTPADSSVYFMCKQKDDRWYTICYTCPKVTYSCFREVEMVCDDYCNGTETGTLGNGTSIPGNHTGLPPTGNGSTTEMIKRPYDCAPYIEKPPNCTKAGIFFANAQDVSIYFECKVVNRKLVAFCHSCSSDAKTCYDDTQQSCVTSGGKSCGTKDQFNRTIDKGDKDGSRTHSCDGYTITSFPCYGYDDGFYAFPGDTSVYAECKTIRGQTSMVSCNVCDKQKCFVNKEKKCKNCAEVVIPTTESPLSGSTTTVAPVLSTTTEKMIPGGTYICKGTNFSCTSPGLFASDMYDTSIYFQCVKSGGKLKSICYTCNRINQTCFSESQQGCVLTNGEVCDQTDPGIMGGGSGSASGNHTTGTPAGGKPVNQTGGSSGGPSVPSGPSGGGPSGPSGSGPSGPSGSGPSGPSGGGPSGPSGGGPSGPSGGKPPGPSGGGPGNGTVGIGGNETVPGENTPNVNNSLTHYCPGYDPIQSFPCDQLPVGFHPLPGDKSVYFECYDDNGVKKPRCYSCPKQENSIYDPKKQTCVKRVGDVNCCDITTPLGNAKMLYQDTIPYFYNCHKNLPDHWKDRCVCCELRVECKGPCIERDNFDSYNVFNDKYPRCEDFLYTPEALFHHQETYYFNCFNYEGNWKSRCFSCLGTLPYCDGITTSIHKRYDCTSYNKLQQYIPCAGKKNGGLYKNPLDPSVFFMCIKRPDGWHAYCFACNSKTLSIFDEEVGACVSSGGSSIGNPDGDDNGRVHSCIGYHKSSFHCYKGEGTYTFPGDKSIYYVCPAGEFYGNCMACSKDGDECYVEGKGCLGSCGKCEKVSPATSYATFIMEQIVPRCPDTMKFKTPEELYNEPGPTYFNCLFMKGNLQPWQQHCFNCVSTPKLCKIDASSHMPHNCSYFGLLNKTFTCPYEGFFPIPVDTSLFVECKKVGDKQYETFCYACPFDYCFRDSVKTCVKSEYGQQCGNTSTTPIETNLNITLTYSCSGLHKYSFPCNQLGPGTYPYPGDKSIYFKCSASNTVACYTCSKSKKEEFNSTSLTCETIKESKITAYNCSGRMGSNYINNCTSQSSKTVFADPSDASVYYKCVKENDLWQIVCYPCWQDVATGIETCFNNVIESCTAKRGEGESCSKGDSNIGVNEHGKNITGLLSYSCGKYLHDWGSSCSRPGSFAVPGDKSVYITCKLEGGNFNANCGECEAASKSIFVDGMCKENGGKGIEVNGTQRLYDCSGYTLQSYPCKKEGKFPHPKDKSVFFECELQKDGKFISKCYECNSVSKSCFNPIIEKCVRGCGNVDNMNANTTSPTGGGGGTGSGNGTVSYGGNQTYGDNCVGYSSTVIPCEWLSGKGGMPGKGRNHGHKHFGHPGGDKSVYFHCAKIGVEWVALCHRCPFSTCFNEEKQICSVDSCKGETTIPTSETYGPYDCRFYGDDAYPCTEAGVFSNPIDTSTYFQCKADGSSFKSVCYPCNSKHQTCFTEDKGTCIKYDNPCGTLVELIKNSTRSNATDYKYDCDGYDPKKILTCQNFGAGRWGFPGDSSVFMNCTRVGDDFEGVCQVCNQTDDPIQLQINPTVPKEIKSNVYFDHCFLDGYGKNDYWKKRCSRPASSQGLLACFDSSSRKCVECQATKYKPYDCTLYNPTNGYKCDTEGYYAQTFDTSVFFRCVKEGKVFKSYCYTCNSHFKTCFSNKLQGCISKGGKSCGHGDPAFSGVGATLVNSRKHSCQGFNEHSVPCDYLSVNSPGGSFPSLADQSVYFTCDNKDQAKCTSCPKANDNCFVKSQITGKYECIPNCGRGVTIKYKCATYSSTAFECKKEGYFAHPTASDVFYGCSKSPDGTLTPYCYSCNSETQTCYNNEYHTCLLNDGKPCGNATKLLGNFDPNKITAALSYACIGYDENSLPCELYGVGKHAFHADKSVYFECIMKDGKPHAVCMSCSKERKECFDPNKKLCIENCGAGKHQPHDCSTYNEFSFPCEKAGYFAGKDPSVFFNCLLKDGKWVSHCYACHNGAGGQKKRCFNNQIQKCVAMPEQETCQNAKTYEAEESSYTYSCAGYIKKYFPCQYLPSAYYAHPGDPTVIIDCTSKDPPSCIACSKEKKSCYKQGDGLSCTDNCGLGPHKPYDCRTYNSFTFDCTNSIANQYVPSPHSSSVFLKCVKKTNDPVTWDVYCYTCSKTWNTCFSQSLSACVVLGQRRPCPQGDKDVAHDPQSGIEENSRTYDCSGYNDLSYPCGFQGASNTPIAFIGDKSVYFTCVDQGGVVKARCYTCDKHKSECFLDGMCKQNCGRRVFEQYSCGPYGFYHIGCGGEEKLFIPIIGDTTAYFKCHKVKNTFLPICFTCNPEIPSCFSYELQACIKIPPGEKCRPNDDPVKIPNHGNEMTGRSYTCDYFGTNFPCKHFGANYKLALADKSIYIECVRQGGKLVATCKACHKSSFYDRKKGACVEEKASPYSCKGEGGEAALPFACSTSGFFPHPEEASIYFKCYWHEYRYSYACYTCPKGSCFPDKGKECKKVGNLHGGKCGPPRGGTRGRSLGLDFVGSNATTMTGEEDRAYFWSCDKYEVNAFDSVCKDLSYGQYPNPGDRSTYIQCVPGVDEKISGICKACPMGTLYNEPLGKCINKKEAYNCAIYRGTNFQCSEDMDGTLVADPSDSSVYFLCVKINYQMKSFCYACNQNRTCFSNKAQRCLPLPDGDKEMCGSRDPAELDETLTVSATYKGYDCKGYGVETRNDKVFPCSIYGPGIHLLPGDTSVYIRCDVKNKAKCIPCSKEDNACFDGRVGECVKDCGGLSESLGDAQSDTYDCKMHINRPNCTSESILAHPLDSSVYLRCFRHLKDWISICYPCPSGTCFDNRKQACVNTNSKCGASEELETVGSVADARSYSCKSYSKEGAFPCKRLERLGRGGPFLRHSAPGDESIWFTCAQGHVGICSECSAGLCFSEQHQLCRKCGTTSSSGSSTCKAYGIENVCLKLGNEQQK